MFFKERMNSQGESIRTCAGRFHSEEQRHHCFGIRSIIAENVNPFEYLARASVMPVRWALLAGLLRLTSSKHRQRLPFF